MGSDGPALDVRNTEQATKVVVPLIGTGFAFVASLLSGFVLYYTNEKTRTIQTKLAEIQQQQFIDDQSAKADQFERDLAKQYVALVYTDLTSKDPSRQRNALSLLEILDPNTALKLWTWASGANVILVENKNESARIGQRLESRQENARFRIYLHAGTSDSRGTLELDTIRKALSERGFSIAGIDDQSSKLGPGIDYFHDADKTGAEQVAQAMTELMPAGTQSIGARKLSTTNRPGVLGVWL